MLIIDRIEGDWAVVEYGTRSFNLPLALLPPEVREGAVISLKVTIRKKETKERARALDQLSEELFE